MVVKSLRTKENFSLLHRAIERAGDDVADAQGLKKCAERIMSDQLSIDSFWREVCGKRFDLFRQAVSIVARQRDAWGDFRGGVLGLMALQEVGPEERVVQAMQYGGRGSFFNGKNPIKNEALTGVTGDGWKKVRSAATARRLDFEMAFANEHKIIMESPFAAFIDVEVDESQVVRGASLMIMPRSEVMVWQYQVLSKTLAVRVDGEQVPLHPMSEEYEKVVMPGAKKGFFGRRYRVDIPLEPLHSRFVGLAYYGVGSPGSNTRVAVRHGFFIHPIGLR